MNKPPLKEKKGEWQFGIENGVRLIDPYGKKHELYNGRIIDILTVRDLVEILNAKDQKIDSLQDANDRLQRNVDSLQRALYAARSTLIHINRFSGDCLDMQIGWKQPEVKPRPAEETLDHEFVETLSRLVAEDKVSRPTVDHAQETDDSILDELVDSQPTRAITELPSGLSWDHNISDLSPVITGTWITVSQIVTLVVDGYTWADILRSHPELTEEGIRTALSYATQQDCE